MEKLELKEDERKVLEQMLRLSGIRRELEGMVDGWEDIAEGIDSAVEHLGTALAILINR